MSALSALVASGNIKKALLLAGDTPGTHLHSLFDKTSAPLFGDAGTATALEFSPHSAPIHFHLATEGAGANAIFLPDGGARNPVRPESLELRDLGDGVKCTPLQTRMNGMDVFAFAVSRAPKSVKALLERFGLEIDEKTILLLHQANRLINEKIRKKLGVPVVRVRSAHRRFRTGKLRFRREQNSRLRIRRRTFRRVASCGAPAGRRRSRPARNLSNLRRRARGNAGNSFFKRRKFFV